MWFARLEARVALDEGFRADPYLDTVGVPTIGYGTTHILGKPVSMKTPPIDQTTARDLLRADLFKACIDAQAIFSRFNELNDARQEVLVNMAYNLGKAGLQGFAKMIAAADRMDYRSMVVEMKDSKWYRQVGQRGDRLCQTMATGVWA